jgi:hypothetical protein
VNPITWLRERPRWFWWAVLGGGIALAASFALGRWAAPTKVTVKEKVVERLVVDEKEMARRLSEARITWEKDVQDHTRIETRYVEGKPVVKIEYRDRDTHSEGTKVVTKIEYVDREKIVFQEKVVEKEKVVERDCPRLTLGASAGYASNLTAGGWATYRFAGPVAAFAAGEKVIGAPEGSFRAGFGINF